MPGEWQARELISWYEGVPGESAPRELTPRSGAAGHIAVGLHLAALIMLFVFNVRFYQPRIVIPSTD